MPGTEITSPANAAWPALIAFRNAYKENEGEYLINLEVVRQSELYRQRNASASDAEIFDFMNSLRENLVAKVLEGKSDTYQGWRSVQDFVLNVADVTASFLKAAGQPVGEMLGAGSEGIRKGLDSFVWPSVDADRPYLAATNYVELRNDLRGQEESILLTSQLRAVSDPAYGEAMDKYFAGKIPGSWREQTVGHLAEHPDLPVPQVIREAIQPDGSLKIDLDKLRKEFRDQMLKLQGSVDGVGGAVQDGLKLLAKLDASMQGLAEQVAGIKTQQEWLVAWASARDKREQAAREAEEQAQSKADLFRAAGSSVYVVSTLIGLEDPKLGRQISVVGNSTLNAVKSVFEYASTASRLSKTLGETLGQAVGGAILTGNILGAALQVISLFGEQGPTADELILEGIDGLKRQLGDLQRQVDDRFNRVDRALVQIYGSMNERFNRLDFAVAEIRDDVASMKAQLDTVARGLVRLEANTHAWLRILRNGELLQTMNGVLNWLTISDGGPPLSLEEYREDENTFHTFATRYAFDPIDTGGQRDFADLALERELTDYPLDVNINFVSESLRLRGMPSYDGNLPNPVTWAVAASAHAQLDMEWPEHAGTVPSGRRESIIRAGLRLQRALQAIVVTRSDAGLQPNIDLFDKLVNFYRAKSDRSLKEVSRIKSDYVTKQLQPREGSSNRLLELWGPPDQDVGYRPDILKSVAVIEGTGTLAPPGDLSSLVPLPVLNDHYLFGTPSDTPGYRLAQPTIRASVAESRFQPEPPLNPVAISTYVRLRLVLDINVVNAGGPVIRREFVSADWLHASRSGPVGSFRRTPAELLVVNWESGVQLRRKFEASAQEIFRSQPIIDECRAEFVTLIRVRQLEAIERASASLAAPPVINQPLSMAATELSGAKLLLRAVVSLGLPLTVAHDDLLQSLLYGSANDSVLDRAGVAAALEGAKREDRATYHEEPDLVVSNSASRRILALYQTVVGHLRLHAAEGFLESPPMVSEALQRVQISDKVAS